MLEPTAKGLVLDLLATVRRGAVPVAALVSAGRLFGLEPGTLRVALARLLEKGRVERDERGLYRLAPGGVSELARGWRRQGESVRRWSGDWIGVVLGGLPAARGAARARRTRALRLGGFRTLRPGLEIRPDNLRGGAAALRERLTALGLDPQALVLSLSDLDAEAEARARRLWDAEALVRGAREMRERLDESAARLPGLPEDEAMVESFTVGGEGIRHLLLDPLLPDEIAPQDERRALLESMKRYDRLGRRAWAGWLGAGFAPPDDLPAGVGGSLPVPREAA